MYGEGYIHPLTVVHILIITYKIILARLDIYNIFAASFYRSTLRMTLTNVASRPGITSFFTPETAAFATVAYTSRLVYSRFTRQNTVAPVQDAFPGVGNDVAPLFCSFPRLGFLFAPLFLIFPSPGLLFAPLFSIFPRLGRFLEPLTPSFSVSPYYHTNIFLHLNHKINHVWNHSRSKELD